MFKALIIGLGGFLGAVARFGLSHLVHRFTDGPFPSGTLAVNVLGSLLVGSLMGVVTAKRFEWLTLNLLPFLLIGFLGSFTTFSAVAYETFDFLHANNFRSAAMILAANVLLGLLAVVFGWAAVRLLTRG